MDNKTELLAERNQIIDLPYSLVAKGKMLSNKHLFQPKSLGKNLLGEYLRREGSKGLRELQGDHFIDSRLFETSTFFVRTRQEPQINVRRKNFHRVRIEREHDRGTVHLASLGQQPLPTLDDLGSLLRPGLCLRGRLLLKLGFPGGDEILGLVAKVGGGLSGEHGIGLEVCDRAYVLEKGRVVANGAMDTLDDALVRRYLTV